MLRVTAISLYLLKVSVLKLVWYENSLVDFKLSISSELFPFECVRGIRLGTHLQTSKVENSIIVCSIQIFSRMNLNSKNIFSICMNPYLLRYSISLYFFLYNVWATAEEQNLWVQWCYVANCATKWELRCSFDISVCYSSLNMLYKRDDLQYFAPG